MYKGTIFTLYRQLLNLAMRHRLLAEPTASSEATADSVFKRVRDKIEAIPLPQGYSLEWGGEHESSGDAQRAVSKSLPLGSSRCS